VAVKRATLRQLLEQQLRARSRARLAACLGAWRAWLVRRVSKRMRELSALLHSERSLLRRALDVWLEHAGRWRYK
jgi:hypothetical protein